MSKNDFIINVQRNKQTIHLKCPLVLGENLGINTIYGFVKSFQAHYYCRLCKCSKEICEHLCIEDESQLRTEEKYKRDLDLCDSSKTGIQEEYIFNSLHKFHVVSNEYVDPMHDNAWILAYVIGKVLTLLVKSKIISLEVINTVV